MRIKRENLPLIHRYAAHGRIVVFDTETTGMTNDDEICQIAAVEYKRAFTLFMQNDGLCTIC